MGTYLDQHVIHHRLDGGLVRRLGLLVEVVHVEVLRYGNLAQCQCVDEIGLARAVIPDEAVAAALRELDRAILDPGTP
jgi:hypothetical protein